ncbi:hypothetical protein [Streptomyces sp. NPDC006335]|uniref:hypothetical protein n=1 Tax=Streptomyces sp. NPDC006335 TaxID=3156895 RepID=UPI0033A486C0
MVVTEVSLSIRSGVGGWVAVGVDAVGPGYSRGGPVMGGSVARVVGGLRELVEVDGDAGDAAALDVRSADHGEGFDIPVGEVLLPALGRLALAPDVEVPLIPVLPDVRG